MLSIFESVQILVYHYHYLQRIIKIELVTQGYRDNQACCHDNQHHQQYYVGVVGKDPGIAESRHEQINIYQNSGYPTH